MLVQSLNMLPKVFHKLELAATFKASLTQILRTILDSRETLTKCKYNKNAWFIELHVKLVAKYGKFLMSKNVLHLYLYNQPFLRMNKSAPIKLFGND